MGILSFLGLDWKPKEGVIYGNTRWHRRRHYKNGKSFFDAPKGGWMVEKILSSRTQNKSKTYIEIDGNDVPGTFGVNAGFCTIGILGENYKLQKLFRTSTNNVEFSEKYLGVDSKNINHTYNYEYRARIIDSSKLIKERLPSKIVRRRGTAIVDTPKGILVTSGRRKLFLLPGGGANKGESREKAAIRELREETELKAISSKYLFEYNEPEDGRKIRNLHKVFLIKVRDGIAKPHSDVKHIAYWKEGSDLNMSRTTKLIIDKYVNEFKNKRI